MKKIFNPALLVTFILLLASNSTIYAQEAVCLGLEERNIAAFWPSLIEENAIILDVRDQGSVETAKIAGSINIDVRGGSFIKGIEALKLSADQPIYVHCRTQVRSGMAVDSLLDYGFERVIWLKGGMEAWQKSHRAVVVQREEPKEK